MNQGEHTVQYSDNGWPVPQGFDQLEVCTAVTRCPNVAVFRVTTRRHNGQVSVSYCCWGCMPGDVAEDLFFAAAGVPKGQT